MALKTLDPVVAVDLDQLIQRGIEQSRRSGKPTLVSLSLRTEAASPIDLFELASDLTPIRHFWSQPGRSLTLVGLGAAHTLEGDLTGLGQVEPARGARFCQAADAWRALTLEAVVAGPERIRGVGPILLGGFAFDSQRPATTLWQGFPHTRLVLPELLFTYTGGETWLTYNAVVTGGAQAHAVSAPLTAMLGRVSDKYRRNGHDRAFNRPVILQRELRPVADWKADVAEATRTIRAGGLEKVVLARAVELQATTPFSAVRALRHLSENYSGCYVFAIAHQARCFLGATPERLIQLHDGEILTMSLAGSIRRGATAEEDAQLGQALLDSAKDRNEHAVVVRSIVEILGELCTTLNVSAPPALLKLGNIQHIYTTLTGELADGRTVFDLVERLHPTPAMGGRPRDLALQLIRECEKLDRGWYAGPVGWVDSAGEGEFAAAIRSALLHGNTATLFTGCGIVADSDPEREYAESILKLKPMLAALGA